MNNQEAWGQYKDYTRDITEFSRKLAFAGAAICWVLKRKDGTFPEHVLTALVFIVGFFIADILQSFIGALLLRRWITKEEIKKWMEFQTIEGEYQKPRWLDYPSYTLFIVKIVLLLIGFIYIGIQTLT